MSDTHGGAIRHLPRIIPALVVAGTFFSFAGFVTGSMTFEESAIALLTLVVIQA